MTITRTLLTTAAALAFTISGASAQFLLGENANGHKEVTNLYAGEQEADRGRDETFRGGGESLTYGAPLGGDPGGNKRVVPNDGDRLDGEGTFRGGGSGLSTGAPRGSDPISGAKMVVGGR